MMNKRGLKILLCVVGLLALQGAGPEPGGGVKTTDFAKGKWDASAWVSVRQANQTKPRVFEQTEEGLRVTKESFEPLDYKHESDNAILVTDTGLDEAQVEVTFKGGAGFNKTSSPGIVISPVVSEGVMTQGIGVFVAQYGAVAWSYTPGTEARPVSIKFAGQVNHSFDPAAKHVIKCRFSKARKSVALQVDDSDVMVLKFIGQPTYGTIQQELNSKVGIWGCHGECEFYGMKVIPKGTLAFDWPEKESK